MQDEVNQSILWRSIDLPGHEHCRAYSQGGRCFLSGAAVLSHEHQPCRLEYLVECDPEWKTIAARVSGWLGVDVIDVEIAVEREQRWLFNGVHQPELDGFVDVDLNFSPSTNLLPIRRLNLAVGQEAEVRAAWLRFPSFKLEPLVQIYRRLSENTYVYESDGGSFSSELEVNDFGFVTRYAGNWEEELS